MKYIRLYHYWDTTVRQTAEISFGYAELHVIMTVCYGCS